MHNSREKERNATLIIKMEGNSTYITDPSDPKAEPRKFAFDYSYWSHDGFTADDAGYLNPSSSKYADQVCPKVNHVALLPLCMYL